MIYYMQQIRRIFLLLSASVSMLGWSLLAVLSIMVLFAVIFTQSANEYLWDLHRQGHPRTPQQDLMQQDFGDMGKTIYSLYTAITGGRNWGTYTDELYEVGWAYAIIFVFFISFSFFGVMNIVTSVFVECAMQTTQKHRDLLVEEKRSFELDHLKHMREIFKEIDMDNSGTVEYDELRLRLRDDVQLQDYFKALELNPTDTLTLFELLDQDGCGRLTVDEFCDGAMRLKGEARAFDINFLIQENRKLSHVLKQHMKDSTESIDGLHVAMHDVLLRLAQLARAVSNASGGGAGGGDDAGANGIPRSLPTSLWDPSKWGLVDPYADVGLSVHGFPTRS
mmetsp:Transcript_464/g.2051  ORF Transcript_464/g.2051 Transcript_464/m.2051 type:complete len:336 (+) Transcript_464:3-1010(+)